MRIGKKCKLNTIALRMKIRKEMERISYLTTLRIIAGLDMMIQHHISVSATKHKNIIDKGQ